MNNQKPSILDGMFSMLNNHAMLTSAGIPSEQAADIAFKPMRVSNERDQHEIRSQHLRSDCCRADFYNVSATPAPFCSEYGNICNLV